MSSNPRGRGGPRRGDPIPPPAPASSAEPPVDRNYLRHQLQILAWVRVGLGAVAGILAGIVQYGPPGFFNNNSYFNVYFAVFIYLGSYYYAKHFMSLPLPQKDKNKFLTQGVGGYIMMFLFFWILYTTFCFSVNGTCPSFHLF